eukprot:4878395-Prorocentrum_lima.AAC.1
MRNKVGLLEVQQQGSTHVSEALTGECEVYDRCGKQQAMEIGMLKGHNHQAREVVDRSHHNVRRETEAHEN